MPFKQSLRSAGLSNPAYFNGSREARISGAAVGPVGTGLTGGIARAAGTAAAAPAGPSADAFGRADLDVRIRVKRFVVNVNIAGIAAVAPVAPLAAAAAIASATLGATAATVAGGTTGAPVAALAAVAAGAAVSAISAAALDQKATLDFFNHDVEQGAAGAVGAVAAGSPITAVGAGAARLAVSAPLAGSGCRCAARSAGPWITALPMGP